MEKGDNYELWRRMEREEKVWGRKNGEMNFEVGQGCSWLRFVERYLYGMGWEDYSQKYSV